jgi:hypothetical protein
MRGDVELLSVVSASIAKQDVEGDHRLIKGGLKRSIASLAQSIIA